MWRGEQNFLKYQNKSGLIYLFDVAVASQVVFKLFSLPDTLGTLSTALTQSAGWLEPLWQKYFSTFLLAGWLPVQIIDQVKLN